MDFLLEFLRVGKRMEYYEIRGSYFIFKGNLSVLRGGLEVLVFIFIRKGGRFEGREGRFFVF